jgi:hypothetical protein
VYVEDKSSQSGGQVKSKWRTSLVKVEDNVNVLIFVLIFQVRMDVSAFTPPPSLSQLFAPLILSRFGADFVMSVAIIQCAEFIHFYDGVK